MDKSDKRTRKKDRIQEAKDRFAFLESARRESLTQGSKNEEEEKIFDNSLRPRSLKEYIGQDSVKENMQVFIEAAKLRSEALDHILLNGPPGLGKTTLAFCIAQEVGVNVKATSGPAIERPIDLLVLLKGLKSGDILFIDEIHRLSRVVEEILYPAMEDFVFDRIVGKGVKAKSKRMPLPRFTLIGATTRSGLLSSPLRDRFGINLSLSYYEDYSLKEIVIRSSAILGASIEPEGAEEIARRSRGTPRIANRLLRRVRDYAQVKGSGVIDFQTASHALEKLGIDRNGLDEIDRRILECLVLRFKGKPAGLDTLSAYVEEDPQNIEEVYEPYLLKKGFIDKTQRGRAASPEAFEYLGQDYRQTIQKNLWD